MLTRHTGSPLYAMNYRYDDETRLMECSYAVIKCTVPKSNEDRKWEYAERYFIPKEEKMIYDVNGNCGTYKVHASNTDTTYSSRNFLLVTSRSHTNRDMFKDAFMALTDKHPDIPPRFEGVYSPWVMTEWIYHNKVEPQCGKVQKIIDTLSSEEFDTPSYIIDTMKREYASEPYRYYYREKDYAYFDKIHNVFRIYKVNESDAEEFKRVYIYKNQFITARIQDGKWVKNGSFTYNQFRCDVINSEDFYAMNYNAYIKDLECKTVYRIVNTVRNPEIEQLFNMGCKNLAKRVARAEFPKNEIERIFGTPVNKNKNVCSRFGLTHKQLQVIDSCDINSYIGDNITAIREIIGTNNLSSIGEDFRKYFEIVCVNHWEFTRKINELNPQDRKKIFIKLCNMNQKSNNAIQIFFDTLSIYNHISVENKPNINIVDFRNYDELIRMHNQLLEIQRIEEAERKRLYNMAEAERQKALEKKMEKLDEKRKELNYEDENFIIRIPKKLSEIVNEGASLHHCVGGYTDRHASGDTTILFLRKKSEPNTSFYTIELRNNNTIQQIHGFGNRWLGNNPEAIATVARWLRKNGISCTDQILRCTATGYGGNNNLVPMPEI